MCVGEPDCISTSYGEWPAKKKNIVKLHFCLKCRLFLFFVFFAFFDSYT